MARPRKLRSLAELHRLALQAESLVRRLETQRDALLAEADAVADEIASLKGTRRPGRPRKRR
ncbi:MAG: hypothetical protein L0216_14750 [Planctomycetales bacterium]|nr:hypothetical protein [Planctomycetales bacterium]